MTPDASPPPAAPVLPGADRLFRDPLTGLANEQLFKNHLPEVFGRARDRETNGAFLALKLDNILAVNALHGRAGGDEALRAVAAVLNNYRAAPGRESHAAFRLSGPFFGYSIPACPAPEAKTIADDIRRLVQQSDLYIGRLTVSVGLVNFYEIFLEEGTREQTALRVEQTALHRLGIAEKQGGNAVCDSSGTDAGSVSAQMVVLLVDPEPESMELLQLALEAAELTVRISTDGESALAAIAESPPRVIICEAMCPQLNGFSLRERLRANALWNVIPFVLVSHRKNEETIRKAVENDIRHFFRKPVNLTEVAGLVRNITRSASR